MTAIPSCAVVGLGKLGLPVATLLPGRPVLAYDANADRAAAVNSGTIPDAGEPHLARRVRNAVGDGRLQACDDPADIAAERDLTVIVVPTPSRPDRTFDSTAVLDAIEAVAPGVRHRAATGGYPVVCVTSTVTPGQMEGPITAAVEAHTGLEVGSTVGLVYSPLFVALGDVYRGLEAPDMLLVGASDDRAAWTVSMAWMDVHTVRRVFCTLAEAEVVKLAVNTFLSVKVAWANHVADVAGEFGADPGRVLEAVGLDGRIGPGFLRAGLPASGPCLPRDVACWSAVAPVPPLLVDAVRESNAAVYDELAAAAVSCLPNDLSRFRWDVALWGVGYKAGSAVTDDSAAVHLAPRLAVDRGLRVVTVDRHASLPGVPATTPGEAVAGAAVHVVLTEEQAWRDAGLPGVFTVDPWRWLA